VRCVLSHDMKPRLHMNINPWAQNTWATEIHTNLCSAQRFLAYGALTKTAIEIHKRNPPVLLGSLSPVSNQLQSKFKRNSYKSFRLLLGVFFRSCFCYTVDENPLQMPSSADRLFACASEYEWRI
jgi:hypothetical protein